MTRKSATSTNACTRVINNSRLTFERAFALFRYDPETGHLVRKVPAGTAKVTGQAAGCLKDGYLVTKVDGRRHLNHRLAWLLKTGAFPVGQIDHINGNGTDNRWTNLREANQAVNNQNQRRPRKDNKTGFLGVTFKRKGFAATIKASNRVIHLGTFPTAEEAHQTYLEAKRRLHPGCTL